MAQRILAFDDASLNPRRRYIKYEYAEYAYVNAAAGAMYADHAKAGEYASLAIKNADIALKMLEAAEQTYQSNKDSQFLLDWVNTDQGKDRVLYFRAMAECMLATAKIDPSWRGRAGETWNLINVSYRIQYPAAGTRQLDGCVAPDKSK